MRRTYVIEYTTSSLNVNTVEIVADDLLSAISILYGTKTTVEEINEIYTTVLLQLYDKDDGGLGSNLNGWDTYVNSTIFREGAEKHAAQQEALKKKKGKS